MATINKPKNQVAEVLYELLSNSFITRKSIFNTTGILNLTARIADLRIRHCVDIKCNNEIAKNKHGRSVSFGKWELVDKATAELKYSSINKE